MSKLKSSRKILSRMRRKKNCIRKMNLPKRKAIKKMIRKRRKKRRWKEATNLTKNYWHKSKNCSPTEWNPNAILSTTSRQISSQRRLILSPTQIYATCWSMSPSTWPHNTQRYSCLTATKSRMSTKTKCWPIMYWSANWEKWWKISSWWRKVRRKRW